MKPEPVEVDLHDIMTFRVYFNWGQKTVGHGQCDVGVKVHKEDGNAVMRIFGDTERMGREWTRSALHALIDTICNAMPEEGLDHMGDSRVDVPIPPEVLAHWAKLEQFMRGDDADGASA